MYFCDLTFDSPEMNLAFDEALLLADSKELHAQDSPSFLRFWEPDKPIVVLGRSSCVNEEVNVDLCKEHGIPILRRVSGGATIVTGSGCLMYAVVINTQQANQTLTVDSAHQFVLGQMTEALRKFDPTVQVAGTSDLVFQTANGLIKFSGNSVRIVRDRILYHGTLLYAFDLPSISSLLGTPPRQPNYRERRTHEEFIGNLETNRDELISKIGSRWEELFGTLEAIDQTLMDSLDRQANQLTAEKYHSDEWNFAR